MPENLLVCLKNTVIYEIFVRNHSRGSSFNEVLKDLERIKELGVDILWFMPLHPIGEAGRKGNMGSPYAIKDYTAIDHLYGAKKDFYRLIVQAHRLEMKVMMDIVYNHTSVDALLVNEYPQWFLKDKKENFIRKINDWDDVYDLDYKNKDLWECQIKNLEDWVSLGIDGFRCDVAAMVPLEFWLEARERVDRQKNLIWLAESFSPSLVKIVRELGYTAHSDPELHQVFDLTYDYDGFEYLQKYFRGQGGLKKYLDHLFIQETLYPAHAVKLRFLENHDTQRIAAVVKNKDSLKNWTVFYALLPGATLVYAGQEVAAAKQPNLFTRDPINWEEGDEEFYGFFQKVLSIAKEIKNKCDIFQVKEIAAGILLLVWEGSGEKFISLVNLEGRYGKIKVDFSVCGQDLLTKIRRDIDFVYAVEKMPCIIKLDLHRPEK